MDSFDLSQTDHLLTTTRTVRRRLDLTRMVDPAVVLECVDIATRAPSASNTQPWRFILVDDPGVKAELAELYRSAHDPYLAEVQDLAERAGVADLPEVRRGIASSTFLARHLQDVPVLMVPCVDSRLSDNAETFDAASLYGSILPAIWSLMLALRSRGIGSALTTLHLKHEEAAATILRVPPTATQIALMPIAHYTGDGFQQPRRRPAADVIHHNNWNGSTIGPADTRPTS